MGAKISEEMKRAVDLVKDGHTVAHAARVTGVNPRSITRSRLYLEWLEQTKRQPTDSKEDGQ